MSPLLGLLFKLYASVSGFVQNRLGLTQDSTARCGDCFCIPDDGQSCPYEDMPETDFQNLVPRLNQFVHVNPFTLGCNPYEDDSSSCTTEPPLETGGACIIDLSTSTTCPGDYSLTTYSGTLEQAQEENLLVTHSGPCGTCSSLQDLSVYMGVGTRLRDESTTCGFISRSNPDGGVQCFQDLGFSESCARTWMFNAIQTSRFCLFECFLFDLLAQSPNGPSPECALAPCLQCDEDNSGPIFKKFAGRTRRSSGLLSNIARPCQDNVLLKHLDPCGS